MKLNGSDPIRKSETKQKGAGLILRQALATDEEMIFTWRNLPEIIALSSSKKNVSRSEHQKWYSESLQSPDRLLSIVTEDQIPIGLMRFDLISELEAEISIYLISQKTGQGLGTKAIMQGCNAISNQKNIKHVIAYVRDENKISLLSFIKNGFIIDNAGSQRQGHRRLFLKLR